MNLEDRLGYRFRDKSLMLNAVTHPSYASEHGCENYQRLEFLGDAVLELASSAWLYQNYKSASEGELTRMRAARVCEESLYRAALSFELGGAVRLSVGEERTGGAEKPSILSDVVEALIGAVYLDGGFDAARRLIEERVLPTALAEPERDPKTMLQEKLQKQGIMPEYELVSQTGESHAPIFRYRVKFAGEVRGAGEGHNKQAAQKAAAADAMKKLER